MTRPSCLPDPRTPVSVPTGSLHARTFFSETSSGKHVPRSLYIDLEPNIVDEMHEVIIQSERNRSTM
ncbi:hypothetical protein BJV77DRAFT_1008047 [Russula vinacea]|nr:hypothetical protein BJV77DRAFT_1008047 [Russula vinacea]